MRYYKIIRLHYLIIPVYKCFKLFNYIKINKHLKAAIKIRE